MTLGLSFHTNFVQISLRGGIHWAPRHQWEKVAKELLTQNPEIENLCLAQTDLELEVSRYVSSPMTLIFPDGLENWLEIQSFSLPHQDRDWVQNLVLGSERLSFSQWKNKGFATAQTTCLCFVPEGFLEDNGPRPPDSTHIKLYEYLNQEDEISQWIWSLAQFVLEDRLQRDLARFAGLQDLSHLSIRTWTADGLSRGISSPIMGLPQALSSHLSRSDLVEENHLFLGWENFYFSHKDSIGHWHTQALEIQPFRSFHRDPNLLLVPTNESQLTLPMKLSQSLKPTVFDVLTEFYPMPEALESEVKTHKLLEGLHTFFQVKPEAKTLQTVCANTFEDIYWELESLRTSEFCRVEGPLSRGFLELLKLPLRGLSQGMEHLHEAHFIEVTK